MNINDFAKLVALEEGGKKEVSIAQIKQILKIVDEKLSNFLYGMIKTLPK